MRLSFKSSVALLILVAVAMVGGALTQGNSSPAAFSLLFTLTLCEYNLTATTNPINSWKTPQTTTTTPAIYNENDFGFSGCIYLRKT